MDLVIINEHRRYARSQFLISRSKLLPFLRPLSLAVPTASTLARQWWACAEDHDRPALNFCLEHYWRSVRVSLRLSTPLRSSHRSITHGQYSSLLSIQTEWESISIEARCNYGGRRRESLQFRWNIRSLGHSAGNIQCCWRTAHRKSLQGSKLHPLHLRSNWFW